MTSGDADRDEARRKFDAIMQRLSARSEEEQKGRVEAVFGPDFANRLARGPIRSIETSERPAVPPDLREFLKDVDRLIRQGDEAATTPSDDLLQADRVYGGLDRESNMYNFTYFPGPGTGVRWEFTLGAAEIHEVGEGRVAEIPVRRHERQADA